MMLYLMEHAKGFAHVIVVDPMLCVFSRAGCVTEIANGRAMGLMAADFGVKIFQLPF